MDEVIPTATTDARTVQGRPDLGSIYSRTAQVEDFRRNPIIVIPGILGSKLVDETEKRVVWGEFGGNGIDPATPEGARLLGLPLEYQTPLGDLADTVKVDGPLGTLNVRVFGVPFQIAAYREILTAMGVGGYHDAASNVAGVNYGHQYHNCFQFAYDWRRDNVETAALLHEFILEKKAYVEEERRKRYGDDAEPVRFDIVAHSMGGVMARYYLQYGDASLPEDGSLPKVRPGLEPGMSNGWSWSHHRTPVPCRRSNTSLKGVCNFLAVLSKYEPARSKLGTMPSIYQLLPRTRHRPVVTGPQRVAIDLFDPRIWVQARWGFFNPTQSELLRHLIPDEPDPQQKVANCFRPFDKVRLASRGSYSMRRST